MPCLEAPGLVTGTRITVASELNRYSQLGLIKALGFLTFWTCLIDQDTVRRLDFKQNCKYFRRDLRRIKEYASEIQNIYFSKS